MRVLALNCQAHGVGYYRHWQPAKALERLGHSVTYFEYASNFTAALGSLWASKLLELSETHDVIHVGFSTHLPIIEALVAAREHSKIPIITDVDDDFFNVPGYNDAQKSYHAHSSSSKLARLHLHISDAVTVTTEPLKALLRPHSKHIYVVPNYHQPLDWAYNYNREPSRYVNIMFAGGAGRYGDLEQLRRPLDIIMNKYPQVRLHWISMFPDWAYKWAQDSRNAHNNRSFYINPCEITTYRKAFKWLSPDIQLGPVETNIFNRSKSCIKAYDAAESGAAFICTDWDTYADVPSNACYKVSTDDQWIWALEYLIEDEEARKSSNANLAHWARVDRNIDNNIQKTVHLYTEVLSRDVVRSYEDIVKCQTSAPLSQSTVPSL